MKTTLFKTLPPLLALLLGLNVANALDGVVIANSSVPAASLSADELKNILTGKTKYWEGGDVIVIVYVDKVTDSALKESCGMDSSAFKTFWQRLAFSGRANPPKKADAVTVAVELVKFTKGAIAIVSADAGIDGVKKVEIK